MSDTNSQRASQLTGETGPVLSYISAMWELNQQEALEKLPQPIFILKQSLNRN